MGGKEIFLLCFPFLLALILRSLRRKGLWSKMKKDEEIWRLIMSDLNEAKQAAIAKIKKAKMETAPKEESSQEKREQLHGELGEQLN